MINTTTWVGVLYIYLHSGCQVTVVIATNCKHSHIIYHFIPYHYGCWYMKRYLFPYKAGVPHLPPPPGAFSSLWNCCCQLRLSNSLLLFQLVSLRSTYKDRKERKGGIWPPLNTKCVWEARWKIATSHYKIWNI